MPTPEAILTGLAEIANRWRFLAVLWHGYFAAIGIAILMGVRPKKRFAGILLGLPLLSVSALAWRSGNPFNGAVFALTALALFAIALSLPPVPVRVASSWPSISGALLFVFGWVYPHFLESESPLSYLYSAPTGLIPCPTLSIVIGLSLLLGAFGSRAWSLVLGTAGGVYAIIGALYLDVSLDWSLLFGALMIVLVTHVGPTQETGEPAEDPSTD